MICNLRRHIRCFRNQLAPIYRLPTEILCSILDFAFCPDKDHPFDAFRFSQVSQWWRETVISFPPLWSNLFVAAHASAVQAVCLERASQMPLSVTIRVPDQPETYSPDYGQLPKTISESIDAISPHGYRVKRLEIAAPNPSKMAATLRMLEIPLPNLKHFQIQLPTTIGRFPLPLNLFGGASPMLESYICFNLHVIQPPSHLFVNLTTVELRVDRALSSPSEILEPLRVSLSLQSLRIYGYTSWDDDTDMVPVSFPQLTKLWLNRTSPRPLLSCMDVPAVVDFFIDSPKEQINGNGIICILPDDVSRLNFLQPLTSLLICDHYEGTTVELKGYLPNRPARSFTIIESVSRVQYLSSWFGASILDYIPRLSLSRLEYLFFNRGGGVSRMHLRPIMPIIVQEAYRTLSSLTHLVVIDPFWECLLEPLKEEGVCPRLENLTIFVTGDSCEAIVRLVHDINASRVTPLKVCPLRIRYGGEELEDSWRDCCRMYGVECFEDRRTRRHLRSYKSNNFRVCRVRFIVLMFAHRLLRCSCSCQLKSGHQGYITASAGCCHS